MTPGRLRATPTPTNQLDEGEAKEDGPGHDAADRCYAYVEGHRLGRRVDQTPDAEAEADGADKGARADRIGSAALGSAWHAFGHSRSLERGLAHARVGAFAAAASERRVDDEQQAVDESAVRRAGLVRLSYTTTQIVSADNISMESAPMLNQVADGVWVRQSEWVWSNAIVVRGESGLVLVDPGIDGSDLNQLADDVDRLGIPVVAGFSTHPHWDHLLWHSRFGDVPRYATPGGAQAASEARERAQTMAAQSAAGIPLELIGLLTPLPADGGPLPGEIVEHQAHAIGHAGVLLADRGVLLAGDMLSDVLIPLLDPHRPDQVGAFETALDRLGEAARHVDVMVPGHGAVAEGPEVAARLAADHAYIDALRRGEEPIDARLDQDWLSGPHQSNVEQARHSSG